MIKIIKTIITLLLGIPVSVLVNIIVGYPNPWVIDSNSIYGREVIWLCFCIAIIGHIYEIFTNKQRNIICIIGVIWLIISPSLVGSPPWLWHIEAKYGIYDEYMHQYSMKYFKVMFMFMIFITGAYVLSIYKIRIVKQFKRLGN